MFVDHQVVEHDDLAGSQRGHEDLLDVRQKRRMVERTVEDGRRQPRGLRPLRRMRSVVTPLARKTTSASRQVTCPGGGRPARAGREGAVRARRWTPKDLQRLSSEMGSRQRKARFIGKIARSGYGLPFERLTPVGSPILPLVLRCRFYYCNHLNHACGSIRLPDSSRTNRVGKRLAVPERSVGAGLRFMA